MDDFADRSELASFVTGLDSGALAEVLLDLADDHQAVRDRLRRLRLASDGKALSEAFTERLARWRDDDRYIRLQETGEFERELSVWLREVEREVLPHCPRVALALFEAFIELDQVLFNRVDDSGGEVCTAFDQACELWRDAATAAALDPAGVADRVAALLAQDGYGARRSLMEVRR